MEDLFKKLGKITKPDNVLPLCVRAGIRAHKLSINNKF